METKDFLLAFLLPVFMCVVLPITIVLITNWTKKSKLERKYRFLEKCIDNGVEINPELLMEKSTGSKATLKTKLLNRLTAGIILLILGIGGTIWTLLRGHFDDFILFWALIAVGIGLLVWYFFGKKMLAEDIEKEETFDNNEHTIG